MKPNYILDWDSPQFAIYSVFLERREVTPLVVLLGLLRWLGWLLTHYHESEHGEHYRLLTFHFSVIRGPHTCFSCGRATTQGADAAHQIPAHCGKRTCFERAHEEIAP